MRSRAMKRILISGVCAVLSICAGARSFSVKSPSGNNVITLETGKELVWSVEHDGQQVLEPSALSMTLADGRVLGPGSKARSGRITEVRGDIHPVLYRKSVIKDDYNCLTVKFRGKFNVELRAYDSGVAYRFVTRFRRGFKVAQEDVNFKFGADCNAFIPYANDPREGYRWSYSFESYYDECKLSEMIPDSLVICPMLVDEGSCKLALMDAGQEDYPGLFLKSAEGGVTGEFAPLVLDSYKNGANMQPSRHADYIADCPAGARVFPWRVAVIADSDIELAGNDLYYCLAPECRIDDTSWIKPGNCAWEWWNAMNVKHAGFEAGSNTATYKYYTDFAAEYGLDYVLLDGGWSGASLMEGHEGLDLPAIVQHATDKGVGVFVWAAYADMIGQYRDVFPYYAELGIKGCKLDFFDRDDQAAMRDIFAMAECAAQNHLMLDLHGMKAFGINRAYPNVVSYEGVKGLENCKWADIGEDGLLVKDLVRYDVTIPFIRALMGPYDYTPGAMDNAQRPFFKAVDENPMSEGTRAHQMAMYTVYDSPFQMLSDTPEKYRLSPECTAFMAAVPCVFDRTVVLDGKVGEYIVTAKEKDGVWYVGAMTDRTARDLEIDFSFLDRAGRAEIFADGKNAGLTGTDYTRTEADLAPDSRITVHLAAGGGWAAMIR